MVQALVLRNLMFGSSYCEEGQLPVQSPESILNLSSASTNNSITMKRSLALAGALVEILWRCGGNEAEAINNCPTASEAIVESTGAISEKPSRTIVCFNGGGSLAFGPGSELRIFYDLNELTTFVKINLHRFDCIGMVYSAVLSRGIQK